MLYKVTQLAFLVPLYKNYFGRFFFAKHQQHYTYWLMRYTILRLKKPEIEHSNNSN